MPPNITNTPSMRPSGVTEVVVAVATVVIVVAHQVASPPVVVFASGEASSNWSTSTLEIESTTMINQRGQHERVLAAVVDEVAQQLLLVLPPRMRPMRNRRLIRNSRMRPA
ncbi:MAG: hypothetical protein U0869_05130 [Chloroflexota bacterium]